MDIPTTFIIESTDKKRLPTKMLVVFLKNLFRFGRAGISTTSSEQVLLFLTYCPEKEIVQAKLEPLPVKYYKVFAENEEEFALLQTREDIAFVTEGEEQLTTQSLPSTSSSSSATQPPPAAT